MTIINKDKQCPNCKYYKLEKKVLVIGKKGYHEKIELIISIEHNFSAEEWEIFNIYLCGNCNVRILR